jgi:hypothetical protein
MTVEPRDGRTTVSDRNFQTNVPSQYLQVPPPGTDALFVRLSAMAVKRLDEAIRRAERKLQ